MHLHAHSIMCKNMCNNFIVWTPPRHEPCQSFQSLWILSTICRAYSSIWEPRAGLCNACENYGSIWTFDAVGPLAVGLLHPCPVRYTSSKVRWHWLLRLLRLGKKSLIPNVACSFCTTTRAPFYRLLPLRRWVNPTLLFCQLRVLVWAGRSTVWASLFDLCFWCSAKCLLVCLMLVREWQWWCLFWVRWGPFTYAMLMISRLPWRQLCS